MVKSAVPTFNVLVAGDPCTGKTNFIKRLLYLYPPSAEVRRQNGTIYFIYKLDKDLKIQLHDVSNIKTIDHQFYDKMNVVIFCYAANDCGSFQNLEKWIRLMKVEEKNMHSFLVADMSDIDNQQDDSKFLAEQACELKERFRFKRFIESYFDDEESASNAFLIIFNEISEPKLNEKLSPVKLYNKSPEKLLRISPSTPKPLLGKTPLPNFLHLRGFENLQNILKSSFGSVC